MAFLSSPGSTNEVDTANIQVSTVCTPVSTVKQIHEDDLEEMDLKWQLALLSMRSRRYFQRTGKKITINGSDTAGYDKTKVLIRATWLMMKLQPTWLLWISQIQRDASFRDLEINALNLQIEKVKKEKESNQIKITNFENASKSLDKLIGSQISNNSRTGLGFASYNVVAPLPPGLFAPPTIDLSNSGLEEFQHLEFIGYGPKASKSVCIDTSNEIKKDLDALINEDWVSDSDEDKSEVMVLKFDNVQHKPEQANQPRKVSQNPKNNRTNWNEMRTQKLGVGFQFTKKACFVCRSFNHLIKDCDFHDKKMVQKPVLKNMEKRTSQREVRPVWNNTMRINHQNFSNSKRNFAPIAVLTKSRIIPISTVRKSSSKAAAPVSAARPINTNTPKSLVNVAKPRQNDLQKSHSLSRRPFYQQTALKNRNLNNKINTAKGNRVTSAVGKQGINVVKSLACWGDPQDALKDQGYFDSGCSRHMTENISYLTDFKEHDGGYVAFRGGAKGGKITRKGTIRTGIKREYSMAITPQQNRIAERRNMTLIEAARTMVLVVKLHFKTPYELFRGRSPALRLMRPFGCHVTILNILDQLGKFDEKLDEWIFVGYSTISKAFKVYNNRTRKVEENLHITFLENKPMITGGGPEWLFDIDALLESMNYAPVLVGTNSNDFTGKRASFDADSDGHNKDKHDPSQESKCDKQERPNAESSAKNVNTIGPSNNTTNANDNTGSLNINIVSPSVNIATPTYVDYPSDPLMPDLEDTGIFDDAYDDRDEGAEAD
nr:hypothetical protein [Tanacetum cinerariifolium]